MTTTTDGDIDRDDFGRLAEPFRRELVAYGYRMLGSVDDAEEIVQDVYPEAWRAYERFEARSSLRTWLYRIATRAFVKAAARRKRRPLPSDLNAPAVNAGVATPAASPEVTWLQPAPDSLLAGTLEDPAAVVAARHTMRLAFVAALQVLPPRQRAVLILRDVLQWRSSEVASLLDLSVAAVNSALQRARASPGRSRHSGRAVGAATARAARSIRGRVRKRRRRNLGRGSDRGCSVRDATHQRLVPG